MRHNNCWGTKNDMHKIIHKWWPPRPEREDWAERLSRFYAENSAYHEMTAGGSKTDHPQVRLLMALVKRGMTYTEVGCGGGEVSGAVASQAAIRGFDISPIAVNRAIQRYGSSQAGFAVAPAENLPLSDSSVEGAYSFEVLEHLWNPVLAIREMVRVVKPGGFVLISCPNHFSLDLHLRKRLVVRLAEIACAFVRLLQDKLTAATFVNLTPDIGKPQVYPDCDMISSLLPWSLPRIMRRFGCRLVFLDTFYMCAHRSGQATLQFQRNSARPFLKWFGDHILLLAIRE